MFIFVKDYYVSTKITTIMKKLLLLFALAAFAACGEDSSDVTVTDPQDQDQDQDTDSDSTDSTAVSFTAAITPESKVASDAFESGDQIQVTAFNGTSTYASKVTYTYGGTSFTSTSPIKLTSEDQALSYIAAYPSVDTFASTFSFTVKSDQSTDENLEMSDLLVSAVSATSSTSPKLTFAHALSSLTLTLVGDSLDGGTLTIYAKATTAVDLSAMTYGATGDVVALTPTASGKVIFAPQTITAGTAIATYQLGDKTYTWTEEADKVFTTGYGYTHTWTIDTSIDDEDYEGEVAYTGNIDGWGSQTIIE